SSPSPPRMLSSLSSHSATSLVAEGEVEVEGNAGLVWPGPTCAGADVLVAGLRTRATESGFSEVTWLEVVSLDSETFGLGARGRSQTARRTTPAITATPIRTFKDERMWKFQAPISKLQRNSKFQAPKGYSAIVPVYRHLLQQLSGWAWNSSQAQISK